MQDIISPRQSVRIMCDARLARALNLFTDRAVNTHSKDASFYADIIAAEIANRHAKRGANK